MDDTGAIIVGAGPTGLTLAVELCLAGVRPLVLERRPEIGAVPKAGGLSGQILRFIRCRDLGQRVRAAATAPAPTPRFPFGGLHIDYTRLAEPPMQALPLPQAQLEALLQDYARELGAEIRRGHTLVGLSQDGDAATADVEGPDGRRRVSAQYLVGCDGVRSSVRALAGIDFPGTVYPEVNRLAKTTMPDSVTLREDGDYEVPGLGLVRAGFTRTEHGEFAISSYTEDELGVYTSVDEDREYDDDAPMTVEELRESIRRVLGAPLPLGEPVRLTRFAFGARHAQRYRAGRVLVAGDAAHQFPASGAALGAGMLDAANLGWKLAAEVEGWAPDGLLDTYHEERRSAGERTMLHAQAQVALRRGHDPAAEALRELFLELLADEEPLRRIGSMVAGSDIRYSMPGSDWHELVGAFAPDLALRAGGATTDVARLLRPGRPVLLDLADRADAREIAGAWRRRVDVRAAETERRPADAILIRPDGHVVWAAAVGEPAGTAGASLVAALSRWFGAADPDAPVTASVRDQGAAGPVEERR